MSDQAGRRGVSRESVAPFWDAPDGVCRVCGKPVTKPRRRWCDGDCLSRYMAARAGPREIVWERDHGICASCGIDCRKVELAVQELADKFWPLHFRNLALDDLLRGMGMRARNPWRSYWEADHIVPVVEGGGPEAENLRTLCLRCHRHETKALAARRALARRKQKAEARGQGMLVDVYGGVTVGPLTRKARER